jgi:phage tail-like protein
MAERGANAKKRTSDERGATGRTGGRAATGRTPAASKGGTRAMAIQRDRPYLNGNFLVDLGTGDVESVNAGFIQVILPAAVLETVEYRLGNDRTNESHKLVGAVHYEDLVLRRGINGSLDLYQWWDQARNGSPDARRNVRVQLLNEDRTEVVFAWRFTNAMPARYTGPTLDAASGSDIAMEELVLSFERLEIE